MTKKTSKSLLAAFAIVVIFAQVAAAQTLNIPVEARTRIFASGRMFEYNWVGAADSTVVVHRSGEQRFYKISAIDSITVFRRNLHRSSGAPIFGALAGATFMTAVTAQYCDQNCGERVVGSSLVGALLGAGAGFVLRSVFMSNNGKWVRVFPG